MLRLNTITLGLYVALFVLSTISYACADDRLPSELNEKAGISVVTNVAYGPDLLETMDLCLPRSPRQDSPVLLLIHGGGWAGGDKSNFLPSCKYYATKGIAAATINYRLFNKITKANQWPTQIIDAQLAVRWIRAHARELKLNRNKICAYGDSAGGHLALLLGLLTQNWPGDRADSLSSESSSVACVVDNFGPTDLKNSSLPILKTVKELVPINNNAGGTSNLDKASPLFHVHPSAPPTLIVQGRDDELVPRSQSISLRDAMLKNGVYVKYVEYLGGHQYKGLAEKDSRKVMELQEQFIFSVLGK